MARLTIFAILAVFFIACAQAEVITLTEATFNDKVKEQDTVWFIKFFAPWCGHCKRLAPVWDELGKVVEADDGGVEIAKVDCTTDRPLCEKSGIAAYPTLKIFYNGEEVTKYSGSRDLDSLKQFVTDTAADVKSKATEDKDAL